MNNFISTSLAYMQDLPRCSRATNVDPRYQHYHDHERGVPVHDDRLLFEMLILEGAQAGLSRRTVLRKREHYRQVFDHFDPTLVANYDETKIQTLLADPGIIRNQRKIRAAVTNAQVFLAIQAEYGSFDHYLRSRVGHQPIINQRKKAAAIPASTDLSTRISKDLKKRGMTFVGPTIIYAYLQAVGVVDDHEKGCRKRG